MACASTAKVEWLMGRNKIKGRYHSSLHSKCDVKYFKLYLKGFNKTAIYVIIVFQLPMMGQKSLRYARILWQSFLRIKCPFSLSFLLLHIFTLRCAKSIPYHFFPETESPKEFSMESFAPNTLGLPPSHPSLSVFKFLVKAQLCQKISRTFSLYFQGLVKRERKSCSIVLYLVSCYQELGSRY